MKLAFLYDHHNASAEWSRRELDEWLTDVFAAPAIALKPRCTPDIRRHVLNAFSNEGWTLDVKIDQLLNLTVFAMKADLAFQLQTGNMSRAPYDLLKLQYLFQSEKINCAAMALPTRDGRWRKLATTSPMQNGCPMTKVVQQSDYGSNSVDSVRVTEGF